MAKRKSRSSRINSRRRKRSERRSRGRKRINRSKSSRMNKRTSRVQKRSRTQRRGKRSRVSKKNISRMNLRKKNLMGGGYSDWLKEKKNERNKKRTRDEMQIYLNKNFSSPPHETTSLPQDIVEYILGNIDTYGKAQQYIIEQTH